MIFLEKSRDQAEAIFASRKEKSDYVPYEFIIHKGLQFIGKSNESVVNDWLRYYAWVRLQA